MVERLDRGEMTDELSLGAFPRLGASPLRLPFTPGSGSPLDFRLCCARDHELVIGFLTTHSVNVSVEPRRLRVGGRLGAGLQFDELGLETRHRRTLRRAPMTTSNIRRDTSGDTWLHRIMAYL